jgi:hypothetical protein
MHQLPLLLPEGEGEVLVIQLTLMGTPVTLVLAQVVQLLWLAVAVVEMQEMVLPEVVVYLQEEVVVVEKQLLQLIEQEVQEVLEKL